MKYRIFPICILFTGLWIFSNGQKESASQKPFQRFSISVSGGWAVPSGKFSRFEIDSTEYYSNISGIPLTGIHLKSDLSWFFSRNLGVIGSLSYSNHKTTAPETKDLFYDACPWCHPRGFGISRTSYEYESGKWSTLGGTIGTVARFEFRRLSMNFSAATGFIFVKIPETSITEYGHHWDLTNVNYDPYVLHSVEYSRNCYGINFNTSFSLQFNLTKHIGLFSEFNYSTGKISYGSTIYFTYDEISATASAHEEFIQENSINKNISLLKLNFGILFSFK